MSKLGYTRQTAAIPCHRSNTTKTRYDKENHSNGKKTVYEPAKGTQWWCKKIGWSTKRYRSNSISTR